VRVLTPAERLIVAADFKPEPPNGREWVREQVLALATALKDLGIYLKLNTPLRACGYGLIDEIHALGLLVFADLKLFDILATLAIDGALLKEARPEIVTTVCGAGVRAMRALKAELLDTEVLGVTVLTDLTDEETRAMFTCSTEEAVLRLARFAANAEIDGLISAATQAGVLRSEFGLVLSINTPAIRPSWAIVPGDDQNPERIMTPAKAIQAGADRVVIGRPIVNAKSPYDATVRTIEEIALAVA
jgi:orotidine-5'-phosphate decarboxylase